MSRIGKKAINIPAGVSVSVTGPEVTVKGPQGNLAVRIPNVIEVTVEGDSVQLANPGGAANARFHGLSRTLVANLIAGVSEGYKRTLEINGVGYRAAVKGDSLSLSVGFSHPVEIKAPAGIKFEVEKNLITVAGIDKQLVGAVAARVRDVKKPEPYKGKGIRYIDERVRRKAGKSAAKGAKAA